MGSLSKTPGDSNQKIMGSFRFGIALLVLTSVVTAKDVFRYVDEETGQSHYMTGDPGSSVEGGWTFTNSDGTFELAYKADEAGFQPEADHIPIPVEDTNEVTGAKNTFYTLYDEQKAKVEAGFVPEAAYLPDTNEVVEAKNIFYSLVEEQKAKVEAAKAEAVVDARRKRSPQDVFRYEDAETGQSHYMTGEPGKAVEGGFTFTNPEGSYELVYKADEMGFQPEAAHIPISVEDTNEVVDAKTKFYSLYDEHKAKVEAAIAENAATVVDARRKREAHHGDDEMDHGDTDTVEKSQDLIMPPHPYNFHPFLGLGAVKPEDSANKLYKYIPYYGFVPAEEEDEEENVEDEEPPVLYKYDPLYGFVKADQEIKPLEEQEYKYTPYVGFVPVTGEEEEDVKTYKFNPFYGFVEKNDEDREQTAEEMKDQQYKFVPFHGFVPVNEDGEIEETAKNYGNLKYTFHPYYGFLPTPTDGEVEAQLYKLDPVVGFYPSEKTEEVEVEEVGAELEAKRKKRDAQFLYVPPHHLTAQYLPVLYPHIAPIATQVQNTPGRVADEEDTKPGPVEFFVPGRVATEEETGESTEETKPAVAPLVPINQALLHPVTYPVGYPVGYPAIVPVTQVVYPVQPVQGQAMLPEEEFPVIPHNEEDTKPGPVEF